MAVTFEQLVYIILSCYADDINIFGGSTEHGHILCIALMFRRLKRAGLRVDIAKIAFFVKTLQHLGFEFSEGHRRPAKHNIDKILKIKITTVKDVRSFRGMVMYYASFLGTDFQKLCGPINKYTCKGVRLPKKLPKDLNDSIEELKKRMAAYPVLRNPDFDKRFYVGVDASHEGIGGQLRQKHDGKFCVVAYFSSALTPKMRKYSSDMLELIGATVVCKRFRHYLRYRQFTIHADNIIAKYTKGKLHPGSLVKYVIELQEFDFVVEHVPGKQHHGPDLLSRAGARDCSAAVELLELEDKEYMVKMTVADTASREKADNKADSIILDRETWIQHQTKDKELSRLVRNDKRFAKKGGIWYYLDNGKCLAVVPETLKHTLLRTFHGLFAHRGARSVTRIIQRYAYWPGVRKYVKRWVAACVDCNRRKMNKLAIGIGKIAKQEQWPFRKICIDFVSRELPHTEEGYIYGLLVICSFTRFPVFIALKDKEPTSLGDKLFEHVFSIFGFPYVVHSDNEQCFVGPLKYIFRKFGVRRSTILPRHPEGNAHAERFMRYINTTLTVMLPRYPDWPHVAQIALFAYRAVIHETTGHSPFYLMFGREMVLPFNTVVGLDDTLNGQPSVDNLQGKDYQRYVDIMNARLTEAFKLVRRAQALLAMRNKTRRDEGRLQIEYAAGDPVYYNEPGASTNKQGRMRAEPVKSSEKVPRSWMFQWSGPHIVVRRATPLSYIIWHNTRNEKIRVHVTDLRLHHPFSKELFDTSTPPMQPSKGELPPQGVIPSAKKRPSKGTLCVYYLPEFDDDAICVLKYMGNDTYWWYGNYSSRTRTNLSPVSKFAKTQWLPGWVAHDNRIVYTDKKQIRKDWDPFTAHGSELRGYPILFDVRHGPNKKFSRPLVKYIERRIQTILTIGLNIGAPHPPRSSAECDSKSPHRFCNGTSR